MPLSTSIVLVIWKRITCWAREVHNFIYCICSRRSEIHLDSRRGPGMGYWSRARNPIVVTMFHLIVKDKEVVLESKLYAHDHHGWMEDFWLQHRNVRARQQHSTSHSRKPRWKYETGVRARNHSISWFIIIWRPNAERNTVAGVFQRDLSTI